MTSKPLTTARTTNNNITLTGDGDVLVDELLAHGQRLLAHLAHLGREEGGK